MNAQTCSEFDGRSNNESWLAHIADLLGAEAALFCKQHPDGRCCVCARGHPESDIEKYRQYFHSVDPLPGLLRLRPDQRSLAVNVKCHPAYRAQREFLSEFLQKNGVVHVLGFAWLDADACQCVVQLHRLIGGLPFLSREGRELEQWVHHWRINEATLPNPALAGLEAHERRRSDVAAQLAIPLAVLDACVKVVWANPAARRADDEAWKSLFDQHRKTLSGNFCPEIHQLVRRCLRQHGKVEAVFSINDEKHFAVASPLDGQPGLSLLQMSDLKHETPGIKARLQRLLKLSPAESELAVLLATGASLSSIAELRQVTPGTIRAQLQTIYRKTETHRQSELVCLVQGLSLR